MIKDVPVLLIAAHRLDERLVLDDLRRRERPLHLGDSVGGLLTRESGLAHEHVRQFGHHPSGPVRPERALLGDPKQRVSESGTVESAGVDERGEAHVSARHRRRSVGRRVQVGVHGILDQFVEGGSRLLALL